MRRLFPTSPRRVLACVLPVTVVLLGLVVWLPLRTASEALEEQSGAHVQSTAAIGAHYVGRHMADQAALVRSFAGRDALLDAVEAGDGAALEAELTTLLGATTGLRSAFLLAPDGTVVATAPHRPDVLGDDFAGRGYFAAAVTDRSRPYVSEAFRGATEGAPKVVVTSMAVHRPGGSTPLIGVLAASYEIGPNLQRYVDDFERDEGVSLLITDQHGNVVAGPGAGPAVAPPGPLDGTQSSAVAVPGIGWYVRASVSGDLVGAATDRLRGDGLLLAGAIGALVVACLLVAGRALTALRRERVALRQSNERFEAMLRAATEHAIVGVDPHGYITVWNEGAERVFGWPADQALDRPLDPDLLLAPDETEATREWRHTRPDGTVVTVAWTVTAMDGPGGRAGMIGIATDVSWHRAAVAALVASESRYRSIVDLAAEGIWTLDADGRTTLANARLAEMLGYDDAEELVGLAIEDVAGPDGLRVLLGAEDGQRDPDVRLRRRDGLDLWVMLRATPVTGPDGSSRGVVAMVTDVTDRRRAEADLQAMVVRLREADRVKTDFVSSVSHELRTPLTSIVGYLELLSEGDAGPLAPQQQRMLGVVERNSRRLLTLIEDLLTLSRVESGAFRIGRAPVAVGPLVESVEAAILPAARAGGLSLDVDVEPGLDLVLGDAPQLERVLLNLLTNAVKFTPEGGRISLRATRAAGGVELRVSDTGIGIPPDEQAKLFTRFFRSSMAQEQAIQGTGLGLAIVKTIIDHHGGTIRFSSAPGKGTAVRVHLPGAGRLGTAGVTPVASRA